MMKSRSILMATMALCASAFATDYKKVTATISQIEEAGDATRLWLTNITGDVAYVPLGYGSFLQTSQPYLDIYPSNQDAWKRFLSVALTATTTGRKVSLSWDNAGTSKTITAMKLE